MKALLTLALGVAFAIAGSVQAEEKKAEFDPAKFVGKWEVTGGKKDGTASDEKNVKDIVLVVEKEKLTLKTPIGDFAMKYTIDAKASPVTIDLEITDAPDKDAKGSKSKGILEIDGDKLKLSYHPKGGDRPKNFDAKKDSGEYMFTAKRVKSEK